MTVEDSRSTIGLFHHPSEQRGPVVGRQVVVDDFVQHLARCGRRYRYALFCHEPDLRKTKALLEGADRASVHDRRELRELDAFAPTAWHEMQFDTATPFALRARARVPYPVTVLHHTLSYKELLHQAVLRLLLAGAHTYDAVICTSPAAGVALKQLIAHVADAFEAEHGSRLAYRGRIEHLPLAVDTDRFRPGNRTAARERFHLDDDAFVLLWVGRLSAIDKADLLPLVHVLAALRAKNPGRKLRLVCAGTEHASEGFGAALSDYARHRGVGADVHVISDVGSLQYRPELYAAADVFVSPVDNVQESFGLTPVEAMACGVPQVVSDWNGYRHTVAQEETGFLVPTYWAACQEDVNRDALLMETSYDQLTLAQSVVVDPRALEAAIQRLLDQPALAVSMGARSRQRAEELYSWPVVVARYEAIWEELAKEARRSPEPQRDPARYASPDYGRAFGHFATRQLGEETRLQLTALGRDLLNGAGTIPATYVQRWRHLDVDVLKRVLVGLVRADEKGEPLRIGRILAVLGAKAEPSARSAVLRHVLFLMKYGFAEEVPA
jgi:D-inositol-3-phosphate glycosyltransferase